MFFLVLRVDQDVIKVYDADRIDKVSERLMDVYLESG
jgi:hypothetical protein